MNKKALGCVAVAALAVILAVTIPPIFKEQNSKKPVVSGQVANTPKPISTVIATVPTKKPAETSQNIKPAKLITYHTPQTFNISHIDNSYSPVYNDYTQIDNSVVTYSTVNNAEITFNVKPVAQNNSWASYAAFSMNVESTFHTIVLPTTPVPEPGTMLLALLGIAFLRTKFKGM